MVGGGKPVNFEVAIVQVGLRFTYLLSMNLVAADVSPLHLIQSNVRADSRRLLRFKDLKREFVREFLP